MIYDSGNYQGCLDKAMEDFDYAARRAERPAAQQGPIPWHRCGGLYRDVRHGPVAAAGDDGLRPRRLGERPHQRRPGGKVTIFSGSMSQGHGHVTVLAQIAADALQIPIDHVAVVQGDTRQVQAGHGTFNSRSMAVGGSSVKVCAGLIVAKAKRIAANMKEADEKDVTYEGARFAVIGTDISLTFAAVARMAYVGHVLPDGLEPGLDETLFYDPTGMGAPSGVHMAYVEVDADTGIVDILDYVAVDDAGTIINPLLAAGRSMAAWCRGSARRSTRGCTMMARPGSC